MNFSLRQKIFLGYIVMISFTLLVGMYAIFSLRELSAITKTIVFNSIAVNEKLTRLNDSILAQDLYEKRSLMLQQQDAENLFWTRSREFRNLLGDISRTETYLGVNVETLVSLHEKYNTLFTREIQLIKDHKSREAEEISGHDLKSHFNKILLALKDMDLRIKSQQDLHVNKSNALSERALLIMIVLSAISFVFGLLFATLLTNHLNAAIERLKEATNMIRSGDFDSIPEIKGADELADLAISFREMSSRLKELEVINLDANPLTKLPGNLAIEKELLTRLNETQSFSFCLVDLDNFKAYNDRYSYARGSDLIKWMAEMLTAIKKEYGAPEDFLGHIGGDDFVIICSPDRIQKICTQIIEEFDKGIPAHYDPEDAKKGFIISIDRNDKPAMFGIMTVSLAVVNTDRTLVRDPMEISQKVAELKQYAKSFAKSIYIMDRRRIR
ncbi:MAG: diguanylate cyclase [Nitrospirae bacterium]|nr:diguanylate cyclase [Nitrospirota bacterium]